MKKKLEEFFDARPGMAKKYGYPGTYRDFASDITSSVEPIREPGILGEELIKEAKRLLADEISLGALNAQLSQHPIISYADHHGLLNFKLLYNSNLLYAEIIKQLKQPFVVVFASGIVPMVNKSHPRGFYFKGQKTNFFAERKCRMPLFLFQHKLEGDRRIGLDSLISSYSKDAIGSEEKKFLEFLFFDCLEVEKAGRNYDTLSEQFTFLNYKLWKYYFDETIRESVPNLIYLQSNQMVINILINELEKKESLISSILFEPKIRRIYLEHFTGIATCWGDNMGSQFFWGVKEKKKIRKTISLRVDDASNCLTAENFSIELQPEEIIAALKTHRILPTLFLEFLVISFIEGFTALGGFNQIEYLTQMQEAHVISLVEYMIQVKNLHIKCLNEIGMHKVAEQFATRVTDGFVCGMFPFGFDSAIDMLWEHNSRGGKFNGNLDRGLTQNDLDRMLDMKVRDMIASGVETMLENV